MNSRRELLGKIKDEFNDLSEKDKGSVLEYAAFLSTSAVEREFISEYARLNATQSYISNYSGTKYLLLSHDCKSNCVDRLTQLISIDVKRHVFV